MSQAEIRHCLHLAQVLNLIVSSHHRNGQLYVYTAAGYPKPWDEFIGAYPPERLQSMAERTFPATFG